MNHALYKIFIPLIMVGFVCQGHGADRAARDVSYYRLRVEFTTTAKRSVLELKNPENILIGYFIDTMGELEESGAHTGRMILQQSERGAQAKQEVGMIFDLALSDDVLEEPLRYLLLKEKGNTSFVKIYYFRGEEIELLHEVELGDTDNDRFDAMRFEVDLSPLKRIDPFRKRVQRPKREKLLLAAYYTWYNQRDWEKPILEDHPLELYVSSDPEAIARHIDQAKSAGIDGFVTSWWGPETQTDRNLKLLLDVAREKDFLVGIYFETVHAGSLEPRDAREIYRWLEYFLRTYQDHPNLLKADGKPVIVFWMSAKVKLTNWRRIFSELRARGLDGCYMHNGLDESFLPVFDGLHEYSVFHINNLMKMYSKTKDFVDLYPLLAEQAEPKIWMPVAQTGFDSRGNNPMRQGHYQDREGGAYYRRTFEAAIASDPDWIIIATWNEWWENSHIEPSELYGDQYLKITREYARKWKGEDQ